MLTNTLNDRLNPEPIHCWMRKWRLSVEPLPPWMRPRGPVLHVEMRNAYQHFAAEVCPRFTNHRIPVPTIHNPVGQNSDQIGERNRHETWYRHRRNHEARGYRDPLRLSSQSSYRTRRQCRYPPGDGAAGTHRTAHG